MSFQGDIASFSLGDVFQNLATNQKTGTLKVQSGNTERYVLFRDGKAVSYSDDQGFSIAGWLVEKEIISQEQLEEAIRRYKKAKKKSLGEILRDMELLKLEDYTAYLSSLIQETLYEVLSFQEGTFEFLEGLEEDLPHREPLAAGLSFPAQNLLMEAARRSDDWQNVRRHVPSENEIYLVPPANRERLLAETKDEVTREAIQLMDGTLALRRVIAKLPYSRFDACRAISQLIAEKKVRPLDGSVMPQVAQGSKEDPKQVIACLKTILEREPNNRQILEKLAELHTQAGQRDESATCWKLLANSYLEDGEFENVEKSLRKSLALNPKDIVTWKKLLETVKRGNNRKRMMEVVRDHLAEMVKLFPDSLEFKLGLADARFALGDHKACVAELLALALEYHKLERWPEAEKVFAQVLKYDNGNAKAKKLHEEISTGRLLKRKAARQRAVHVTLVTLFCLSVVAFVVYDYIVQSELFAITRSVYAESLIERGRFDEAAERIRAVERKYPFAYTTLREATRLRAALESKSASAHRPEVGPQQSDPAKAQAEKKPR
jgi:tetratricopeptide (TPR) repeat protein